MSTTTAPQFIARTEGYITIDIPPVAVPTPLTAARWLATSPAVRTLVLVLIGIAIGYHGQHISVPSFIRPTPDITVTESLTDFVSRESEVLTAEERAKLIIVTKNILEQQFDTPSAMREEFRLQRLKAGIDSPAFHTFQERWSAKVAEMNIVESVESVREVYEALLHGLQAVKSYIDFTEEPGMASEIVTESPEIEPDQPTETIDGKPPAGANRQAGVQRQGIFRRR